MPTILVAPDVTAAKYNLFTYTINASFSGLTGPIQSAQITTFVPDYIQYTQPPIVPPLKKINVIPGVVGTQAGYHILFDFGSITQLGKAIVLRFGMKFKRGIPNGTTYTATYNMVAEYTTVATEVAEGVTLNLVPKWVVSKSMVIPSDGRPAAGSIAYYLIKLQNIGDPYVLISNVEVKDTLADTLTIDPSFIPIGKDWSGQDAQANGVGSVEGQTLTFNLSNYKGNKYYMVYKVRVSSDVAVGTEIINTANWTIDGVSQPPSEYTIRIGDNLIEGGIGKYGPLNGKAGNRINYEIYLSNTGNEDITGVQVVEQVPDEIIVQKLYPGSFWIPIINHFPEEQYTVAYELNHSGQFSQLGVFDYQTTNYWSYQDLTKVLNNQMDKVTALRWEFPVAPIGCRQHNPPRIEGRVVNTVQVAEVTNRVSVYWEDEQGSRTNTATTKMTLDGKAKLNGTLHNIPKSNVIPGDKISYESVFSCWNSQVDEPVLLCKLPLELEYMGNVRISYTDYFNQNAYYDLNTPNTPIPKPEIQVIPQYQDGDQRVTLIRISLKNFSIHQRSSLFITFDTRVRVGALGQIKNQVYFISGDQTLASNTVINRINFSTSVSTDKKVKGELDKRYTEYPEVGRTTEGGKVDYQLTVTNTGNVVIESFELVDIFPYMGDTGVILNTSARGSSFPIYMTGQVEAEMIPLLPGQQPPSFEIKYSSSSDPVRFNALGTGVIGSVEDWTDTPSGLPIEVRAIKLKSKGVRLSPGQSLVLHIEMVAPVGVVTQEIAWNSYALLATYYDELGRLQKFLPVEPEKVGVQINEPEGKVSIGYLVWLDQNEDGIKGSNEQGVNGIEVKLYDKQGNLIKKTMTANNKANEPGCYLFTNLEPGSYKVGFTVPMDYGFSKQYRGQDVVGSKPYPQTGQTKLMSVNLPGTKELTANAGIYKKVTLTQNQGIDIVLVSIGMEEMSLAHLVNAEAEKIQFALGTLDTAEGRSESLVKILEVNQEANKMLRDVIKNQMLISMKMEDVMTFITKE